MTPAELIRDARRTAGLSQQQLAARAGTSQPAVARYEAAKVSPSVATLDRLLRACGRALVLSAEPVREAGGLAPLLRERRDRIRELAEQHGAWNVRVFGSVARGADTETSDVDLLVDLDDDRDLLDLIGLERELEDLLGVTVDVATAAYLKPHVRASALAEAIPL